MSGSLPGLREDLRLLPAAMAQDGSPAYTLHDPVENRFFRLGFRQFEILSRWELGTSQAVAQAVNEQTTLSVSAEEVEDVSRFLLSHGLFTTTHPLPAARLRARFALPPKKSFARILYFRLPLVRPDPFLRATLPWVRLFFTPGFVAFTLLCALVGLWLVGRQWEAFLATFPHFFGWHGMLLYGVTFFSIKVIHELGHAYAARLQGVTVPVMGVGFMFGWPVLFTDTSEGWRICNRRGRLLVSASGMLAELVVAAYATLLWSFLPEGTGKSAAFLLATLTWTLSLLVNLNPFMRFDGYFLLSDWLEVENLQERAFASARWHLRRLLLGLSTPPPEALPSAKQATVILYAYGVWIYRLFLFTGIALMVYHLFFKALGVVLFFLEVLLFIGWPIQRELAAWWGLRGELTMNRHIVVSLSALVAVLGLLFVPWRTTIHAPALFKAREHAWVHAPFDGRITEMNVQAGGWITKGEVLFRLEARSLAHERHLAVLEVERLSAEMQRQSTDALLSRRNPVYKRQWEEAVARRDGLGERMGQQVLTAPLGGRLLSVDPDLSQGAWVGKGKPMALIADTSQGAVLGYLAEADLAAVQVGDPGRFLPENPEGASVAVTLSHIAPAAALRLEEPALASPLGGEVAARGDQERGFSPVTAQYPIRLEPQSPHGPERVVRGMVAIRGRPASLAERISIRLFSVFIRESGF